MRWLLRLLRHEARRLHAAPWWKRAALGLVVLALGLIVLTRPLESLTLLVALVVRPTYAPWSPRCRTP